MQQPSVGLADGRVGAKDNGITRHLNEFFFFKWRSFEIPAETQIEAQHSPAADGIRP